MIQKKFTTNLTALLLKCVSQPDPMLSMLEWLCDRSWKRKSRRKSEHSMERNSYRPRRFDTRMGTIYLMVPKIRQGGYVPFFVSNRKRRQP